MLRTNQFTQLTGLLLGLSACSQFAKPTEVVVEGTLLDKYTQRPLAAIPVLAQRYQYGNYGVTLVDSLTSTRTDASGRYKLAFTAGAAGHYRIKPALYRLAYYDLTSYPDYNSSADGVEVTGSGSFTVDFKLVPLIPTKIRLAASKLGRSALWAWLRADDQDGQGYFSPVQVVLDSVPATQQVVVQRTVPLVPNRTYTLTLYRADVHCQTSYTCKYLNENYETLRRTIAYPDTALITVP